MSFLADVTLYTHRLTRLASLVYGYKLMSDSTPTFTERRASPAESWHLKKEIQLGQIASILIFGLTGVFYVTTMDKRITVIESQLIAQKERDAGQDKAYSEAIAHLNAQMDRMDSKLDRLVERSQK